MSLGTKMHISTLGMHRQWRKLLIQRGRRSEGALWAWKLSFRVWIASLIAPSLVAYPPIVLEGRASHEMQSVAQEMRFRSWRAEGNGSTVYPPRCRQAAGRPNALLRSRNPQQASRYLSRSNSSATRIAITTSIWLPVVHL